MKLREQVIKAVAQAICEAEGGDPETWEFWTDTASAAIDAATQPGIAWLAPWEPTATIRAAMYAAQIEPTVAARWMRARDAHLAEQGK